MPYADGGFSSNLLAPCRSQNWLNRRFKVTATIVHRLPVDGQAWLKCHIEGTSEPVDVDAFDAALEVPAEAASPLFTNHHQDYQMTRRSILISAAASLICAPAIVRATSLMPVRSLPLQIFESGRRILPTLLLSLARPWMEKRPNDREYQRENSVCSRRPPDGRVCAGTRMAASGRSLCISTEVGPHPRTWITA